LPEILKRFLDFEKSRTKTYSYVRYGEDFHNNERSGTDCHIFERSGQGVQGCKKRSGTDPDKFSRSNYFLRNKQIITAAKD
jgi:hypothetical protein